MARKDQYRDLATVLTGLLEASIIESNDIGAYAIELAVRGWAVFPLRGKVPAIPNPHPRGSAERQTCTGECGRAGHGVLDATTNLEQVTAWWAGPYAGANVGARVPDNVMVLDTDPRHGGADSLAKLVAEHGPLPDTLTAASARGDGGRHRYLRAPAARLTSKYLGAGIDVKTHNGYCVMPPSIHPDTGKPYRWAVEAEIAAPPILTITRTSPFSSPFSTSVADDYGAGTTWAEILQPHGWRCLDPDGDADGARWLHPNATSACSATVRHTCLFVYSPNTPFDPTEAGDVHGYTKFRALAVLDYRGDLSAAARALRGAS